MRRITPLVAGLTLAAATLPTLCPADDPPPLASQWSKITIDKIFRSEGATAADVNKDGKMDVIVGDFWYEAPDWKIHQLRECKSPRRACVMRRSTTFEISLALVEVVSIFSYLKNDVARLRSSALR